MINSLKEPAVILQPFEDCVLSPDTVNMYLDSICVMEADGADVYKRQGLEGPDWKNL